MQDTRETKSSHKHLLSCQPEYNKNDVVLKKYSLMSIQIADMILDMPQSKCAAVN